MASQPKLAENSWKEIVFKKLMSSNVFYDEEILQGLINHLVKIAIKTSVSKKITLQAIFFFLLSLT